MGKTSADVVIVGAGHGGAHAAIFLRQLGFAGSILMIGREAEPPYERPPLSKEYLAREKSFERLYIRPPQFWPGKSIDLALGCTVTEVAPDAHRLTLASRKTVNYGNLIWATGGDPRRLDCRGAGLDRVHTVRERADVDRITIGLDTGARRVAIIGGGYIGLEAAAVLTKLGCEVVLLEALPRVLTRVAGEALSAFFESEHRAHGVDVRTGAQVTELRGKNGRVDTICLATGETVPVDMVIVGIGIVPSVGPLLAAGAKGDNGVEADAYCRTSLTDIYAIGDCAAHANEFAGGAVIRLESVQNAADMAKTAASAIVGTPKPYRAVPWFWSNQFDIKLQTVGLSRGHDKAVLRGDPAARRFSIVYLKQDVVIALDCINAAKDFVQGKALVENRVRVDPSRLANVSIPLREIAEAVPAATSPP